MLAYCEKLKADLSQQVYARVVSSKCKLMTAICVAGERSGITSKRGVPLRIEVGPKDIAKDAVFMARRDTGEQTSIGRGELISA